MSEVVLETTSIPALCADNVFLPKKTWLSTFQKNQLAAFMSRGFPSRREELWKYTDLSALGKREFIWPETKNVDHTPGISESISIVFVNGKFSSTLSDLSLLPRDVVFCSLSSALDTHEEKIKEIVSEAFDIKKSPMASLNSALMTDGVFLWIPKNKMIVPTIHFHFINTQEDNFIICPRNIIIAEDNSQVTLVEEYTGLNAENYFTNSVTHLCAEKNAKISHYKIQAESASATHIAMILVKQKNDSRVSSFCLDVGGRLVRHDVNVALQERGAECQLNGFYHLTQNSQHVDNHVHVDHIAAHGTSSMLYKGILDKKSRAVFNGKVCVHKDAQQTHAQQANHNLLLSPDSEVDTKPELEIYADDVKCTHGATIGQLDTEALFYLRARGIEKSLAMELLTYAFADDVFNKVEHPPIQKYLELRAGRHVA